MKALIDSDILVYRIAFTTEEEDLSIAHFRMNELVEKILADVNATSHKLYLTASGDDTAFRPKLYPGYKANRKAPKPKHYNALREFLISQWNAEIVFGIEADDALGIDQYCSENTVICTIDKDLDMIPGWHYNFVKEKGYHISEEEAIYNFYKQLLMGDRADNIKGIEGIGEKKAERILEGATDEETLFNRTKEAYNNDEDMFRTGETLWILRKAYPTGLWRYTTYGSRLVPEKTSQSELDLKMKTDGMEFTGEEILPVGSLPNGQNLLETSVQMEKKQTLT